MCISTRSTNYLYIVCLLLIFILLTSCSSDQQNTYFPLQEGLQWHYQVTIKTSEGTVNYPLVMTNHGKETIDGKEYYMRRSSKGIDYYLQYFPESGEVVRVAKRTFNDRKPVFDENMITVLKAPLNNFKEYQESIHNEWVINTQPYLLKSTSTSREDHIIRKSVTIPMVYKVISNTDVITTVSGQYEDCLHIRGRGNIDVRRILSIIADNIQFDVHEWYAPNVGLVKMTWSEIVDSSYNTGGDYQLELVSFDQ